MSMIGLLARRLAQAFKHFQGSKRYSLLCFGCDSSQAASAMDHSPIRTCVLKMNVKCANCQRKVKKTLQKIHGVHSINIDANEGKVEVSSTVDPNLFIATLAKAGKKAEVFWEPAKPQGNNNQNQVEHQRNSNMQSTRSNAKSMECDSRKFQLAQMEDIAKIPGLKQVELNQSGNIKMIFRNGNDLDCCSEDEDHHVANINVDDGRVPRAEVQQEVADERAPPTPPATPSTTIRSHCSGDAAGAGSSAHCCHDRPEVKFDCREGSFAIRFMEEPPIRPVAYYVPPPPQFVHPFAPPPPSYHIHQGPLPPHPPAARPPPYYFYGGEDDSACSMM